jgi:hypothetical protein
MDRHKRMKSLLTIGAIAITVVGCRLGPLFTETPTPGEATSVPAIEPG